MSDRQVALVVLGGVTFWALALGIGIAWHSHATQFASSVVASPGVSGPTPAGTTSDRCESINGLPDPICTPGVADPRVTQANIRTTICVSGYTTKVRPSTAYTNALKVEQIKAYGYADTSPADYEEDHLIPLELGGHPTDPKNLWPEALIGANAATTKDGVENSLHHQVCVGLMTLLAAQTSIAKNWESA